MTFLATTRIAVLRAAEPGSNDTGDETYGDLQPVPGLDDLVASVIERTRSVWDHASGAARRVRFIRCRTLTVGVIKTGEDAGQRVPFEPQEDDIIRDNQTGRQYVIDIGTVVAHGMAGQRSIAFDLRDTTTGLV